MISYLKKHATQVAFFTIVLIAVVLRFYLLGSNPPSLDWDEASLGYNAYSILKTGVDEYGNRLPISIRSFDDYKPPLYVYLTIPSVAAFGLTELAVRLPSAMLGVIAVIATYFFALEIFTTHSDKKILALVAMFFFAISPWHLQFSRAAFEGNIGLTFFLLGLLFFLKAMKNNILLFLSISFFVFSMYSYHSFRLIVPLIILALLLLFWKEFIKKRKMLFMSVVLFFLLCMPVVSGLLLQGNAGSRLSMVTIFAPSDDLFRSIKRSEYDSMQGDKIGMLFHNRRVVYFLAVAKGYLDHFNPDFLFLHGDGGRQHHAVDVGMLYLWELPFIVAGFVLLWQKIDRRILMLFTWFFLAPIASAISTGTPHPVRAIAMIPAFHIFTAFGVVSLYVWVKQNKPIFRFIIPLFAILFLIFNILYYLHQYYVHTPIEYGDFWQDGHKQVFAEIAPIEGNYDKIIMTYMYDQPYVYYLFYRRIEPFWYQKNWDYNGNGQVDRMKRVIGKYEFRNINWDSDKNIKNALIVGTPKEIPNDATIIKEIKFLDGSVAFRIAQT